MPRHSLADMDVTTHYLGSRSSKDRVAFLRRMRAMGVGMPLSWVSDLLCLDIPLGEKAALLDTADSTDPDQLEATLIADLAHVDQALAILMLEAWHRRTARKLWHRLLELPRNRMPMRVTNFCLDNTWSLGGHALLEHLISPSASDPKDGEGLDLATGSLADLSGPTQAVLLKRLLQWSMRGDAAMVLAERLVLKTLESSCPSSPAIAFAGEYIARFEPNNLYHLVSSPVSPRLWSDHLLGLYQQNAGFDALLGRLAELLSNPPAESGEFYRQYFAVWPPVWLRHRLPVAIITAALQAVLARPSETRGALPGYRAVTWELFAGIPPGNLDAAVAGLQATPSIEAAQVLLGSLLSNAASSPKDPKVLSFVSDDPMRTACVRAMFREGQMPARANAKDHWAILLAAYRNPGSIKPKDLLAAGRKIPAVFTQCLFRVIERQAGVEEMMPALFDQLHTDEPGEQLALAQAFVGLGTARALGQAVSMISRSEVGLPVKFELCQLLLDKDLTAQQPELRQIITGLEKQAATLSPRERELIDSVKSLLVTSPVATPSEGSRAKTEKSRKSAPESGEGLDAEVRLYVPNFDELPIESQRALRMGRLILRSLSGKTSTSDGAIIGAIDVSPLVDLQYKSLEIFFRAHVARPMIELIQSPKGILQRKLDMLGYGRPGHTQTEAFEAYLTSLPIVADIPEFSHFKLHRVLTAIAGYRPGKRFVLDGLKAYAVVYLTFGRHHCEFGLQKLLPTGFATERLLLEYCRDLHILHAIRNQTAHEGLSGHRIHETEALWHLTGSLFTRTLQAISAPSPWSAAG